MKLAFEIVKCITEKKNRGSAENFIKTFQKKEFLRIWKK